MKLRERPGEVGEAVEINEPFSSAAIIHCLAGTEPIV